MSLTSNPVTQECSILRENFFRPLFKCDDDDDDDGGDGCCCCYCHFLLLPVFFLIYVVFDRIIEDTSGLNLPTTNCPRQDILFIEKVQRAFSIHLVMSLCYWCSHC